MNFLEIVDEVLFDRFSETRRAGIKRYVNARYGRVWAQEPWTFKRAAVTTSVSSGVGSVTLASLGLQRVEGVWRVSGNSNYDVNSIRPEDFPGWVSTVGGTPYEFTIYGNSIQLDRSPSSTTSLIVLGELAFAPMVNDTDEPLLPEEFHMMLVHGAASEALRMENDPTWQGFEQDYLAYLEDLKKGYLTAVRSYGDAFPAWVPTVYGNY